MKTLMIFLMLLGGICIGCINSTMETKSEKTITLTQDELMGIYQHGYTYGAINQSVNSARPITYDNQWRKDSLYIVNMFYNDLNVKQ